MTGKNRPGTQVLMVVIILFSLIGSQVVLLHHIGSFDRHARPVPTEGWE